jgi:hypothetical protein
MPSASEYEIKFADIGFVETPALIFVEDLGILLDHDDQWMIPGINQVLSVFYIPGQQVPTNLQIHIIATGHRHADYYSPAGEEIWKEWTASFEDSFEPIALKVTHHHAHSGFVRWYGSGARQSDFQGLRAEVNVHYAERMKRHSHGTGSVNTVWHKFLEDVEPAFRLDAANNYGQPSLRSLFSNGIPRLPQATESGYANRQLPAVAVVFDNDGVHAYRIQCGLPAAPTRAES